MIETRRREGSLVSQKRLVLDEDFTYGLIYRAHIDGYAEPYSQDTLQHPYSQNVLKIGARPEIQQKLLPSLLLYESIYIEPFDNFALYSFNRELIYPQSETKQSIIAIQDSRKRSTSSDEVKKYLDSIPPEMIVDLLHDYILQRDNIDIDRNSLIKALREDIPKSFDTLNRRYYELASELFEPELAPILSSLLGLDYKPKPLDDTTKNRIAEELRDIESSLSIYSPIASAYTYIAQKMTYCEAANAHLLSTFLPTNPTVLHKSNVEYFTSNKGDEWSALVGVVFKNMAWIRPRSYDDFLQLSENRNIQEFRNFFHDSLEDIREGRTTLEKVDKRVRSVTDVIKRMKFVEKFDNITFWISLPIGILSNLVLPGGAGIVISLALASPKLYSYVVGKKYRWALVDVALSK
jgi:hypothetical protein